MNNWKRVDRVRSSFYLVESDIKEYMDRYEVGVSFRNLPFLIVQPI